MVAAGVAQAVGAGLAVMTAWSGAWAQVQPARSSETLAHADRDRLEMSAILARAAQALDAATAAADAQQSLARELDAARDRAATLLQTQRAAMTTALAATGGKPTDPRAQLVIAQLIRTVATTTGTISALGGARAARGRQVRDAANAVARAGERRAHAEALCAAAGARWRTALREMVAGLGPSAAATPRVEAPALGASGPREVGASPRLHEMSPLRAVPKRTTGAELALDVRLLRAAIPKAGAKRQLQQPRLPGAEPLLPIAGTIQPGAAPDPGTLRGQCTILTSVSQTVSAPVSGTVVFARPFRGLGPLLIIDRGNGYHAVLVGLTRLDVHEAARLVAGQSVGRIEARSDEPASLHLQLRYRSMPIDPAAWPRAHQDKVAS